MKKIVLNILFALIVSVSFAQIESGLLFGLTTGTTSEINSISGMSEGQLVYNTDTKELMVYNGTAWINTSNSNWSLNGNVANGNSFLGSTNDVAMELRSNNIGVLQTGRRQTLGLTQNYQDYTDNNQYITYLKGANGISALQFQADAANFYKPMFFTNSQGNFRLKGSAAGTDFFEIGSAGVSNSGEMEFIIGDDGSEPFIFKRFDYRDQSLKELFRIQGSADTQNALPRVGINTGKLANSTLQVEGSLSTSIRSINSNLTLDETHHTVIVKSNSSISLPSPNTCSGRMYIIKNVTNASINISSYLNNSGTVAGSIPANSVVQIQSDGSFWNAISSNGGASATSKFFQTFQGRAYFYNNTWYSPDDQYGVANQNWNEYKGYGNTPNYSTDRQAGIPITSDVILNKITMKNNFNAYTYGTQQINLMVLRNNSYIQVGTYELTNPSTSITIQSFNVNFQLKENDMLVWACRTSGGYNRTSAASISFEFEN